MMSVGEVCLIISSARKDDTETPAFPSTSIGYYWSLNATIPLWILSGYLIATLVAEPHRQPPWYLIYRVLYPYAQNNAVSTIHMLPVSATPPTRICIP